MSYVCFTDAELATILAALRYYQQHEQHLAENRSPWINDIATNGGQAAALSAEEIDRLCEELNGDAS
jgi:hypothetical protein